MRILDRLREQHRLIEQVAGSLVAFADRARAVERPGEALESFCSFFDGYADAHHHAMEENILLRALRDAGLPETGPIAMIEAEHAGNREDIRKLRALGGSEQFDDPAFAATARQYCARLWEHIDKEDSVLFPEIETRLVLEREKLDREFDAAEKAGEGIAALAELGASLVGRFPPRQELPGVIRGEGCTPCRHFGIGCQGVEREWWSDLEWESFHSRDS